MSSHPLTNFEIQNYYQNKTKFNGVYSRDNLHKRTNRAYVINFDDIKSIGTHRMDLYVNGNQIIYFLNFGVKHIPKEI